MTIKNYKTLKEIHPSLPEDMNIICTLPRSDQYQVIFFLIDLMDTSNYDNIFFSRYLISKIPEVWLIENLPSFMIEIEKNSDFKWDDEWSVRRLAEAMSFSGSLLRWTLEKASSSQNPNIIEITQEFRIYLPQGTNRFEVNINLDLFN
ncbi:MAG: hypothetical protein RR565_08475 [Erysipelothrix sp.]